MILKNHLSDPLTYVGQLEFAQAWRKKYGTQDHNFYFDYVTGVNYDTDEDIPGLVSDGTLTIQQADKILCDYFKIPSKLS